jgi:23S rRNA pseudouridine2605 synthase
MAKEFKRTSDKDKNTTRDSKKRPDKRDGKPSFERFRDDSRPSDFGSAKKRSTGNFRKKPTGDSYSFRKKQDNYGDEGEASASFEKKSFSDKPGYKKKFDDGERKSSYKGRDGAESKTFDKKPFGDKPTFKKREESGDRKKPFRPKTGGDSKAFVKSKTARNPYDIDEKDLEYGQPKPAFDSSRRGRDFKKKPYVKKTYSTNKPAPSKASRKEDDGMIRLNKYLSNAGICSRREADDLIASGTVQVNGKTITEMGHRVKPTDIVKYGGQTLKKERMVYLILNKPKDYLTTFDDPQKRKTVLELVQGACKERIYPVGRLDRATTGLLMFTNDGELTKKLTHPRYGVRKIYHVELDKPLKHQDLEQIAEGIELEDGEIKVDEITYVGSGADKTQVGVEIHSGKNRIVRRIFEHMGYNVRKLDRVVFGSLTKKDLARGRWRLLTEAEVGMLKMISSE